MDDCCSWSVLTVTLPSLSSISYLFLSLNCDDPPAFSFLNLESTKLSPPFATWQCAKPSKSTNSVKNDYLVEPTDLAKKSTQVKTFVFKIFWPCTEADNGECKLWGQDIWRGWPIAKLGKKGRRTCQDCQGERLVRVHIVQGKKDPHSKRERPA